MMGFLFYTTIGLFIFVCFCMILLILIQKGRGGGLASAFGGAGGNTAFGSKTGDVLTWATSVVFGVLLVLGIMLNLLTNYRSDASTRARAAATAAASGTSSLPQPVTADPGIPATTQPANEPATKP